MYAFATPFNKFTVFQLAKNGVSARIKDEILPIITKRNLKNEFENEKFTTQHKRIDMRAIKPDYRDGISQQSNR